MRHPTTNGGGSQGAYREARINMRGAETVCQDGGSDGFGGLSLAHAALAKVSKNHILRRDLSPFLRELMAEKPVTPDVPADAAAASAPPRRSPGHRGAEVKDTVAEMAAKAHEISLEAGSKMAAAMKDVINAAAGLTGFVLESARDLVQYMVRRGQMTQEEADKLIRAAEAAQVGRPKVAAAPKAAEPSVHITSADDDIAPLPAGKSAAKTVAAPAPKPAPPKSAEPKVEKVEKAEKVEKPAAKKAVTKTADKPVAKKAAAKKK